MEILVIIPLIISASLFIKSYQLSKKTRTYNFHIEEKNNKLKVEYQKLKEDIKRLSSLRESMEKTLKEKENAIARERNHLDFLISTIDQRLGEREEKCKKEFEIYTERLNELYEYKEKEFEELTKNLEQAYADKQSLLMSQCQIVNDELNNLCKTREAIIAAHLREKEIKENKTFYCLTPNENEIHDIKLLKELSNKLNNQRTLNMLIWSTYFQKSMTSLCNNVLGTNTVCGVYKITNQNNDMCYIGQSVDISTRWKNHAKAGLGIDTPANNKLYKAMQEEGLWNFSWELLEKCPREELNKKEKYYIGLYKTYEYGYNSNTGVKN